MNTIIKKLYNCIISSVCKNIYTQTCKVFYSCHYISYQINQQSFQSLFFSSVFFCTNVCVPAAVGKTWPCVTLRCVQITIYITCFSYVCARTGSILQVVKVTVKGDATPTGWDDRETELRRRPSEWRRKRPTGLFTEVSERTAVFLRQWMDV